jgi:hypothetical protein
VKAAERDFAHVGRFEFEEGGACRIEVNADGLSVPVPFDALLLVPD